MNIFKLSKTKWTWRLYLLSTPWFGIKIHWIRSEEDEWHTHPWNGFSFILGSYEEQLYVPPVDGMRPELNEEKWNRIWFFNHIGAWTPHRTRGNTLTLFFHGPRINEDWFWGEETSPWRGPQDGQGSIEVQCANGRLR